MFPMRGGLVEGDGLVEEGLNMRGDRKSVV